MIIDDIPSWFRQIWGTIEGAVSGGVSVHDLWAAAYSEAADRGLSTEHWDIQWMNALRSNAAEIRNSSTNLRAAMDRWEATGLEQSIMPDMWATPWFGRGSTAEMGSEYYHIRVQVELTNPEFEAGVQGAEETITQWATIQTRNRPYTTSELDLLIRSWVPRKKKSTPEGTVVSYSMPEILSV